MLSHSTGRDLANRWINDKCTQAGQMVLLHFIKYNNRFVCLMPRLIPGICLGPRLLFAAAWPFNATALSSSSASTTSAHRSTKSAQDECHVVAKAKRQNRERELPAHTDQKKLHHRPWILAWLARAPVSSFVFSVGRTIPSQYLPKIP